MKKLILVFATALAGSQAFAQQPVTTPAKNVKTLNMITVAGQTSDTTTIKPVKTGTLDQLLKKMEGIEVLADGSVTQNGKPITKIMLNGKEYAGNEIPKLINSKEDSARKRKPNIPAKFKN